MKKGTKSSATYKIIFLLCLHSIEYYYFTYLQKSLSNRETDFTSSNISTYTLEKNSNFQ